MTNTELLQKRFHCLVEYRANDKARNIKEWEIFLQDCIEMALTEDMKKVAPCWWEHTNIDIFMALMGCQVNQDLVDLVEEIEQSLHE